MGPSPGMPFPPVPPPMGRGANKPAWGQTTQHEHRQLPGPEVGTTPNAGMGRQLQRYQEAEMLKHVGISSVDALTKQEGKGAFFVYMKEHRLCTRCGRNNESHAEGEKVGKHCNKTTLRGFAKCAKRLEEIFK